MIPASQAKKLPADYCAEFDRRVSSIAAQFKQPRDIPEFGTHIFSDRCCFVRPADASENELFVELCREVMSVHCDLAPKRVGKSLTQAEKDEAFEGQVFYCEKQRKNDKTTGILKQSFGVDWTERYMNHILFDAPQTK